MVTQGNVVIWLTTYSCYFTDMFTDRTQEKNGANRYNKTQPILFFYKVPFTFPKHLEYIKDKNRVGKEK